MKKTALFLILCILLGFSACSGDLGKFRDLRDAFVARGESVEGYEVDEIEEIDGVSYFTVRICLNTDDAASVDDLVWFEANALCFDTEEAAEEAYRKNLSTGLGGTCLKNGKILLYWLSGDYFEDLYRDVFENTFA